MEAIIKGKKISGKVAEILANKGLATPVDGSEEVKHVKKHVKKPKVKK